jgi:hypothetical protein
MTEKTQKTQKDLWMELFKKQIAIEQKLQKAKKFGTREEIERLKFELKQVVAQKLDARPWNARLLQYLLAVVIVVVGLNLWVAITSSIINY